MYNDELMHYGVIGMKWGVRRASKNYQKATTKEQKSKAVDSMNRQMEKASKKLNRYATKGEKKLAKAIKKRYGVFGSDEKYAKAKVKAERSMYKGQKWYNHMRKTFDKQSLVNISDKDVEIGRRYIDFFEQKAGFEDSMYNR